MSAYVCLCGLSTACGTLRAARRPFSALPTITWRQDMTIPARFNPWARRRLLACSFTCALAGMAAATVATVALAPAPVLAQPAAWPARPVRLVVGYAAGGATDVIARLVAARMGEQLGQ